MNDLRKRIVIIMLAVFAIILAGCGAPSKEDVMKKLSGKWTDAKGYELQATMEIKTGAEPRLYDVEVWHTKPEFYRVNVAQEGKDDSQMIVRNEDGVFVVTPSLGKTYKFQSDWPEQNSQAYLIGALSEDIKADKDATMVEEDNTYIFETATRNNHKKILPMQKIHIDKKTLLPTYVSVLNENNEEQIRITFNKITLGTERKAEDYNVKLPTEKPKATEESSKDEEVDVDSDEEVDESTGYTMYYPSIEGLTLLDEEEVGVRSFMTYGGEMEFTVIQEKAAASDSMLPVSIAGDPVDLGFTVAAITDNSISWEVDGVSFFIASEALSKEEMIEVAVSMSPGEMK